MEITIQLEILSRRGDLLSRRGDLLSRRGDLLSRRGDLLSRRGEIEKNYDMALLGFRILGC